MCNYNAESELPYMSSIRTAVGKTGLSEHLLRQLCWKNKIKTVQINSKYYINQDSLREYLSESRRIEV